MINLILLGVFILGIAGAYSVLIFSIKMNKKAH